MATPESQKISHRSFQRYQKYSSQKVGKNFTKPPKIFWPKFAKLVFLNQNHGQKCVIFVINSPRHAVSEKLFELHFVQHVWTPLILFVERAFEVNLKYFLVWIFNNLIILSRKPDPLKESRPRGEKIFNHICPQRREKR